MRLDCDEQHIYFSGEEAKNVHDLIGGRLSRRESSTYQIPLCYEALWLLREQWPMEKGRGWPKPLLDFWKTERKQIDYFREAKDGKEPKRISAWAKSQLFPYQRLGIEFLSTRREGRMLGLDPGLTKTAIALLSLNEARCENALVISPVTLLKWWEEEASLWIPEWRIDIAHGRPPRGKRGTYPTLTIASPDFLASQPDLFREFDGGKWDCLIFDESAGIQNRQTRRFKKLRTLRQRFNRVWPLTGFPSSGYCDRLWTQFQMILPDLLTSYWRWVDRWCWTRETPWAKEIVGNRDPEMLQDFLGNLRLVRSMEQVTTIPDFDFSCIDVSMTPPQQEMYQQMLRDWVVSLPPDWRTADLKVTRQQKLLQIASAPSAVFSDRKDLYGNSGKLNWIEKHWKELPKPLVLWSQWVGTIQELSILLSRLKVSHKVLRGGIPTGERSEIVQKFQAGELEAIICQQRTGKYGLTLTAAEGTLYVDRSFSPDDWVQSLRRIRRVGTKKKPTCIVLSSLGTFDSLVDARLSGKLRSLDELTPADLSIYVPALQEQINKLKEA